MNLLPSRVYSRESVPFAERLRCHYSSDKLHNRKTKKRPANLEQIMKKLLPLLCIVSFGFLFTSCDRPVGSTPNPSANDASAIAAGSAAIDGNELLQHIKKLSSDEFGGRAPGSP